MKATLEPTNRSFTNIETGKKFRLYMDENREFALIYESNKNNMDMANGTSVNGWYLSAHTSIDVKINNSKIVKIPNGSFYNLKEGETVTHSRYSGMQKNFKKVSN